MAANESTSSSELTPEISFFRQAFLLHEPDRHAFMMPHGSNRKYYDQTGRVDDHLIRKHLEGTVTVAAPAAWNGLASYLPLDLDFGGLPGLATLLASAGARGFWAFGQYTPRTGWSPEAQRGYVWIMVDGLTNATRLQLLGQELIGQVRARMHARIEARAHGADTRLPLGRHTHTQRFGFLVLPDQALLSIDDSPPRAWQILKHHWQINNVNKLPALPTAAPVEPVRQRRRISTIEQFNHEHDIEDLLASYGAVRAGRTLYRCAFHDDVHASLLIYSDRTGQKVCRCLSTHSDCPLSAHARYDAFNVYCIGEGLSPAEATKTLTRKGR
ncbi:MAG: hypothetical protein M3R24_19785 [Chloroflexota bacterium]|nr:hypothetical protein [Chloroflexota bacterium]